MRANLLSLLILLFSSTSFAGFSCHLTQQLGNPKVTGDAKFWEEFGRISDKGNDRELADLLKRYDVDARANSAPVGATAQIERRAVIPSGPAYRMNHTAQKELKKLQPNLRDRASEFLEIAKTGRSKLYAELRKNQSSWEFEKLNGNLGYSARLNGGYRVQWTEGANDSIEILRFSKTATHGGH